MFAERLQLALQPKTLLDLDLELGTHPASYKFLAKLLPTGCPVSHIHQLLSSAQTRIKCQPLVKYLTLLSGGGA